MNFAITKIDKFDDQQMSLGGTEIYQPLDSIFKEHIKEDLKRQLFLLTDGKVHNTDQIVKLITSKIVSSQTRVHTLGIGKGVDQNLIKKAAIAGAGSYHLIYDLKEIEEKVILALQKNYTPTRIVTKLEFFDKDQK